MNIRFFDVVQDELAWLAELIPISFHRGAAHDTHRLPTLQLEPILVGPFCHAHAQCLVHGNGSAPFTCLLHTSSKLRTTSRGRPRRGYALLYESSPPKPWLTVYRGREVLLHIPAWNHFRFSGNPDVRSKLYKFQMTRRDGLSSLESNTLWAKGHVEWQFRRKLCGRDS